ncbi:hypothetical protein BJ508DRAFT_323712 [Ascobolus immersus RN42]|uniref:F-box domain-containing protein n=1 Tax=Ascobolus immersus RN42 TaxID=1160509 RepID=A0A3N4IIB2_ASCIM|nr:hypothetical protein BJ508DRAFT_323712 [Ascobolus immersus RN42]
MSSATVTNQQSSSPLFRIPPELRLEIYSHISAYSLLNLSYTCSKHRHEINALPISTLHNSYGYKDHPEATTFTVLNIAKLETIDEVQLWHRIQPPIHWTLRNPGSYFVKHQLKTAVACELCLGASLGVRSGMEVFDERSRGDVCCGTDFSRKTKPSPLLKGLVARNSQWARDMPAEMSLRLQGKLGWDRDGTFFSDRR